ncbi:MAG: radical SAM-associated putative lipoprotein [Paludibacter sp.]|nr:radical SAM-associated putative lipoprotein [Paludibacter sp.]
MRKFITKSVDKIILSLLAMLGFANCETPMEYGTPYADFEINGTVTDSISSAPITKIRVIRQNRIHPAQGDTVYTDSSGKYKVVFKDFPEAVPQYALKVEDTDGSANGGEFTTRNVVVTFTDTDWVTDGDNNWYYGKAKKTTNIKLVKK